MNKLTNADWLEKLPDSVVNNMEMQNAEIIDVICKRLKYFGDLRPTEIHKLTNSIAFFGADFRRIESIIKHYTGLNKEEIRNIFRQAATENDEFARQYYEYRGLSPVSYTNNEYLSNIYRAIMQSTLGTFDNLSDTYGFKFAGQPAMTLRKAYTRVIDRAIYEVQSGVLDYNTAIRQTVKSLADSGIRTIEWDSGYSRRADTSARMNILDGVCRLNQEMMFYHGEQFGSDGVELSAHAISALDHLPVQGKQFSNEEFNKMQDGKSFTDVNGNQYNGFDRPIGEWNCKHFAFPIVIGVSKPVYTDEQLEEMRKNSTEKYPITQEMRKRETEIRRLKERRMAFSSAGNELDAKRTQREIDQKQKEYKLFCDKNGLKPKLDRANVDGYKRISTANAFKENSLHTKKSQGDYGVNWVIVKSKDYTKRFNILSDNENANALAAQRSRNALVNRDGKNTEEIYAISLTSGKDISKITDQHNAFGVERTDKFMYDVNRAEAKGDKVLFIHNHPLGTPPSIADINELLSHQNAVGITVGHNGSLYFYTKPDKRITEFDLTVAIRKTKEYNGTEGEEKTIEELAKQFGFKFFKM